MENKATRRRTGGGRQQQRRSVQLTTPECRLFKVVLTFNAARAREYSESRIWVQISSVPDDASFNSV